jgi:hypothetical protein
MYASQNGSVFAKLSNKNSGFKGKMGCDTLKTLLVTYEKKSETKQKW